MLPPDDELCPTAEQSKVLTQEMPERNSIPAGTASIFHFDPLLVVANTTAAPAASCPTAQQLALLPHDMPNKAADGCGTACTLQVEPPSSVATAIEPPA
jgi:hypothetical protein